MKDLANGKDTLKVKWTIVETSHMSYNYSPPTEVNYNIQLERDVVPADVMKQKLGQMPGFRVTWHYSGLDVEPEAKYESDNQLMVVVRNYSNNNMPKHLYFNI